MPRLDGVAALTIVQEHGGDIPFIIVSRTIDVARAVAAVRAGARDVVSKDELGRLGPVVERERRGPRTRDDQAAPDVAEQFRQLQKMEAVGRLAGGVAHDFNNVLSVILGYAQMLEDDLAEGDPARDGVREIAAAAGRAADLTRQLLMFSRKQMVEPVVLDLGSVVAEIRTMVSRLLGEDVVLAVARPDDLWRVRADRGSIEQLLMNLVVNARDAMPRGGTIDVRTENVALDAETARRVGAAPGDHVRLTVSDDGVGMDGSTIERIFEPFFTTKPRGQGTGLGLSTVFGIVQQSGGTVRVVSEPGSGTTFEILLPRVHAEVEPARAPSVAPPRGSETVLLLEDDQGVREVARDILRRSGYSVIEASCSAGALDVCRAHPAPIDILVSDVVMPDVRGPELARRLVALRPAMKVLLISGYIDDSTLRDGLGEGGFACLQKPLTIASLTARIREVLDAPPAG